MINKFCGAKVVNYREISMNFPLKKFNLPSSSNLSSVHPLFPLLLGHLLDGVAEHGAGHLVGMLAEELAKEVHGYSFAHLAKHPSDGFVHEVVRMVEVDLGIAETPRRVALL